MIFFEAILHIRLFCIRRKRKESINSAKKEKGEKSLSTFIPRRGLPEKHKMIYHMHMLASGVKLRTIIMIGIVEF